MYFFQCPHKFHPPDSLNNAPFSSSSSSSLLTPSSRVSCRNRRPTPPLAPLPKKNPKCLFGEECSVRARRRGRGRQKGPSFDTRVFVWGRVFFFCLYRQRLCGLLSPSRPELDRDAETLAPFFFISSSPTVCAAVCRLLCRMCFRTLFFLP